MPMAGTHIGPLLSFEVEHHAFNQAFKPINFQHKWSCSLTILNNFVSPNGERCLRWWHSPKHEFFSLMTHQNASGFFDGNQIKLLVDVWFQPHSEWVSSLLSERNFRSENCKGKSFAFYPPQEKSNFIFCPHRNRGLCKMDGIIIPCVLMHDTLKDSLLFPQKQKKK